MTPTNQGLDPREEDLGIERLGQEVVPAELEAEHDIDIGVAGRQHEHGSQDARTPEIAADLVTVSPRQHDIQDDAGESSVQGSLLPRDAVTRCYDLIPFLLQPIAKTHDQP